GNQVATAARGWARSEVDRELWPRDHQAWRRRWPWLLLRRGLIRGARTMVPHHRGERSVTGLCRRRSTFPCDTATGVKPDAAVPVAQALPPRRCWRWKAAWATRR